MVETPAVVWSAKPPPGIAKGRCGDHASRSLSLSPMAKNSIAIGWAALQLALAVGCAGEPIAVVENEQPASSTGAATEAPSPAASWRRQVLPGFTHDSGARGRFRLQEIVSGGGALFDYDGDGDLDILALQSAIDGTSRSTLFANDGAGRFEDATEPSELRIEGYAMGVAVADYDGDGDLDLYVTCAGPDRLLEYRAGKFVDVTAKAGLGDPGLGTSAVWLDADGDADLDLYVARYVDVRGATERQCTGSARQQRDYCNPTAYRPVTDLFYLNDGNGRFVDASERSGVASRAGYGLAVTAIDFGGDGHLDIYTANDQSPAFLWAGRGDGTFEEQGLQAGAALNGEGQAIAGMGIVAADLDGDLDTDLFVTNIRETLNLFLEQERGLFKDVSRRWGQADWLRPFTGFGVVAFDAELDGDKDLVIGNGAVMARTDVDSALSAYAEPDQWIRMESGRFIDASVGLPPELRQPTVTRGVADGDLDGDGDVDVVLFRRDGPVEVLFNESKRQGRWLIVEPLQPNGAPAYHARVTVEAGGRLHVATVQAQKSYLVSVSPRLHFGLGDVERIERVTVEWTDGRRKERDGLAVDTRVQIRRDE